MQLNFCLIVYTFKCEYVILFVSKVVSYDSTAVQQNGRLNFAKKFYCIPCTHNTLKNYFG